MRAFGHMRQVLAVLLTALGAWCAPPTSATDQQGQLDRQYTDAIRVATTEPRFASTWVDSLVAHPIVPSPAAHLGRIIGAPGHLSDVAEIHGYLSLLAEKSPRARLFPFGSDGAARPGVVLAIGDEAAIANLDQHRAALRKLADPRVTDAAQAHELIADAKPVYWLTGGIHSQELGPPEMLMELAYRLIVEEREPFRSIRANVITLITPVLEVDGRQRQVEWTRRYMSGHASWVDRPPNTPPFWGKYINQDANRDAIAISQPLTRRYADTYFHWFPTVTLDLHETIPLLYVLGGTGPYNEGFDATTIADWQLLSQYEITRLTSFGMPGVWTWGYSDGWYPGQIRSIANGHNSLGRLFETFGTYTTQTIDVDVSHKLYQGKSVTTRQWYRNVPPPAKFRWSMRNNVNYMQSGVIASLEAVAANRALFLDNFYQRAVSAIDVGRQRAPHAFAIPRRQRDMGAAGDLIDVLRRQRIEMVALQTDATFGSLKLQAGDLLVRLDQPYGPLARSLLERQAFPEDSATQPADDVAWTLGLMFGVETAPIHDPKVFELAVRAVAADEDPFAVTAPQLAAVWVVPHVAQQSLGPLRFALADLRVRVLTADEDFTIDNRIYRAGTLLIEMRPAAVAAVAATLRRFRIEALALPRMPQVATRETDAPRVAVLHNWLSTQDAGWLRFAFDESQIPYDLLAPEQLRAGKLRKRFDIIVLPSFAASLDAADLIHGGDARWGPLAYEKTAATPSLGAVISTKDINAGIGFDGMDELKRFVLEGGSLIALEQAGLLIAETGFSASIGVDRSAAVNAPGSVLAAQVSGAASVLTRGYPPVTHVFRRKSPLFTVAAHRSSLVHLRFGAPAAGGADLVLSGGILAGKERLNGAPALLCESMGEGRVVVFAWNPFHRDLNRHERAFFYNALLDGGDRRNRCGR